MPRYGYYAAATYAAAMLAFYAATCYDGYLMPLFRCLIAMLLPCRHAAADMARMLIS